MKIKAFKEFILEGEGSLIKWLRKENAVNKPKGWIIEKNDNISNQIKDFNKNNDAGNFKGEKIVKEVIFEKDSDVHIKVKR